MDKYLNEDAITAEIMSYVKNRIYNYAVLIDGDWGTGKTYFIQKSIIPTLEGSGYMPIYISLYGVNSTDTVSQKIALSILTNKLPSDKRTVAKQCLPAIGSFVLPIGQTLLNATGISILEPLFKSPVEDIPWDTIFKKFNDSRKRIFIFDDLERCSLPINEILGYINSLVEHESEKVLIVANQQAIGKMSLRNDLEAKYQVVLNPQLHLTEKVRDPSQPYYTLQNNLVDQHITEFTPDQLKQHTAELFSENVLYKEIKEKLVGQELYFHPTLKNILPHIIAESSLDEEVKEVLTQSLDKIVYVFQQENCLNLRSFQSALLTFSRIWNLNFNMNINPLDRHSLLETLFIAILHSTIQQKRGGPRFNWPEKRSYQQYSYSKKVLDFARMFVGFKFVEDYVFDSELDCESAISTINSYVQNEITKPRERSFDPIQKAEKYWLMDDLKVEAIYTELSNCIETHNYCILSSYSFILNQLYYSPDFKTGGESRAKFSQFIGSSIAGVWTNNMLPKFHMNVELVKNDYETESIGSDSIGDINLAAWAFFNFEIDSEIAHRLFAYSPDKKKNVFLAKNHNVRDFLQAFELLGMFFSNMPKGGFKFTVKETPPEEEKSVIEWEKEKRFVLKSEQSQEIHFNALNFAINCIDVKSYFDCASEMLTEIVKQIIIAFGLSSYYTVSSNKQQASHAEPSAEKAMGKKLYSTRSALDLMSKAQCEKTMREKADKIAEKVMSAFQQYSLRNEFEIWAEEGSLPLPLQNFDMIYNMIKRLANTNYYGNNFPEIVGENEVFEAFQQLYQSIGSQLADQDKFYNEENTHSTVTFEAIYKNCPFYKHFVERPSPQMKKIFIELVKAMTRGQNKANAAKM